MTLALCTGLLGLVLGFGAGVWWERRERVWYVDVIVSPEGGYFPCGTPITPLRFVPPRVPF